MSTLIAKGLQAILEEQKKQTATRELMAAQQALLIQALAEGDGPDPDVEPETYMDGSPCR